MVSGYEKSPDYGGPPPTWRGLAVAVIAFIAIFVLVGLLRG